MIKLVDSVVQVFNSLSDFLTILPVTDRQVLIALVRNTSIQRQRPIEEPTYRGPRNYIFKERVWGMGQQSAKRNEPLGLELKAPGRSLLSPEALSGSQLLHFCIDRALP